MQRLTALLLYSALATLSLMGALAGCDDAQRAARESEADLGRADVAVADAEVTDGRPPDARADALLDSTVTADRGGMPDAAVDVGTGDAFVPVSTAPCESRGGMVGVPFADGTCYLMDPRPVSQGEYYAEVQVAPLVSSHSACADTTPGTGPRTNAPGFEQPYRACYFTYGTQENPREADDRLPWPPAAAELDKPMVCVTWCDADAYCTARGKRLCGVRGEFDARRYDGTLVEAHSTSEFLNACTASGRFDFPTGHRHILLTPEQRLCGQGSDGFWVANDLCPDWQGAFQGLWGMGRAAEFIGPWAWAAVTIDPNYGGEPNFEPFRGCRVLTSEQFAEYETVVTTYPDDRYSGDLTFRCCADYDTFE